jgi:hypothetical protein
MVQIDILFKNNTIISHQKPWFGLVFTCKLSKCLNESNYQCVYLLYIECILQITFGDKQTILMQADD